MKTYKFTVEFDGKIDNFEISEDQIESKYLLEAISTVIHNLDLHASGAYERYPYVDNIPFPNDSASLKELDAYMENIKSVIKQIPERKRLFGMAEDEEN